MKILKKLICVITIFVMCLPNLTVLGATENFPNAVLSTAAATENRLDVWAGASKVTPALATKNGKTGWITDITNDDSAKNIYCDVDDSYIFNESNGVAVEIDVEYFDGSAGLFSIVYNSINGSYGVPELLNVTEAVEPVELKGTNTWKTHTFRFYDAKFANGYNGADFAVKSYYTTNGTHSYNEYHNMYFVAGDIVFGSITVRKIPVVASIDTGAVGNIFFGTGDRMINVHLKNTTDSAIVTSVGYEVTSLQTNSEVWNSSNIVSIAANSEVQKVITLPIDKYGPYVLKVSTDATDNAIATQREFDFSVVVDNSSLPNDYRMGFNIHPWDVSYGGTYNDTLVDLVDKTGAGWVRMNLRWNMYEKTPGVYAVPTDVMATIDESLARGIKPFIILQGTHSGYSGAETAPITGDGLVAFEKYCENLARDLTGKVDVFETWNEYNNQSSDAEHYMALLQATYNGVKRGNPEAKLIGFDTGSTDINWMKTIANAGGMAYMDGVSVHPYSTVEPDEYLPERMQNVKNFTDTYGDNNEEVWASEIGWAKVRNKWVTGNTIEDFGEVGSAAYLIKTYAHCIGMGTADKVLYYEFMDSTYQYASKQGSYGVIESYRSEGYTPFAAKPEYIASAFLTNRLYNADPVSYTFNNNNYIYKFSRKNGTSVDVIWNTNENGYVNLTLPDEGQTVIYDLYGNQITALDNTTVDSYNQLLGETPVYVEYITGEVVTGPSITYSINSTDKEATVNAQLSADDAGSVASLIVLNNGSSFDDLDVNPMSSVVYVAQGEVDETGLCSITFAIPEMAGKYNAYLAFEGYDDRYELDMLVTEDVAVVLSVTQNDKIITAMSGLDKTKDIYINARGCNLKKDLSNVKLIYAFYDGEVLSSVNISDIQVSNNEFADSVTVKGPLNAGNTFNSMKVFVWEDMGNISSIGKNLYLK